ncbi:MAG: hypothetical protein HY243_13145 [Proteobacteria bacterium]|nr:hypothetical protein [Pseudomonadota bacterium]
MSAGPLRTIFLAPLFVQLVVGCSHDLLDISGWTQGRQVRAVIGTRKPWLATLANSVFPGVAFGLVVFPKRPRTTIGERLLAGLLRNRGAVGDYDVVLVRQHLSIVARLRRQSEAQPFPYCHSCAVRDDADFGGSNWERRMSENAKTTHLS